MLKNFKSTPKNQRTHLLLAVGGIPLQGKSGGSD